MRGPSSDWDRIAEITGDNGWSWEAMLPYAKKVSNLLNGVILCLALNGELTCLRLQLETFVPPTGKWNWESQYDTSSSGTSGPIRISVTNSLNPVVEKVFEAAKTQFKDTAPFNTNVNDGSMLGVGLLPATIGGGVRNSSANYLMGEPKSNFDLLTEGTVTKVLFTGDDVPKAIGVEYATGPGRKCSPAELVC